MTRCIHCEELQERICQLEIELYGMEWWPPPDLPLTKCELAIVRTLLASNRVVPEWTLFLATRAALGQFAESDMDGTVVKVWISKIRRKLASSGMKLENVRTFGYRLPPETRDRLLHWNEQVAA